MARLRHSWPTSLPVAHQPRNPQFESIARTPYHKRIGLSIQFLSEDPQFAGTMTITWRLEPTSNGTLVAVGAGGVPFGEPPAGKAGGLAPVVSDPANFVQKAAPPLGAKPARGGPEL